MSVAPPSRRRSRAVVLLVGSGIALLGVAAFGCEAIVSSAVPGYTCQPGADAGGLCPQGSYCRGAGCVACETTDVCDGLDNNCDGKIDNGPGSDKDGDGYTICGHLAPDGARLVDIDCNDGDKTVHPGAKELCNGVDDDCNGIVDDPDRVCPSGSVCAPRLRQCVSQTVACRPETCDGGVCDPTTQVCANPAANYPIGHDCTSDKECATGICGDKTTLGSALPSAGVCTATCCSSDACPSGFVCFAPGTGGHYCVDPAIAQRGKPGTGKIGDMCTADTDCRSGLCGKDFGYCSDVCCSDANCPASLSCQRIDVRGHYTFACLDPTGVGNQNDSCALDSSCRSYLCADFAGDSRCAAPCCGQKACGDVGSVAVRCVAFKDLALTNDDTVSACVEVAAGMHAFGDACGADTDCASDICRDGRCSDVCCIDGDCPKGYVCRPATNSTLSCTSASMTTQ